MDLTDEYILDYVRSKVGSKGHVCRYCGRYKIKMKECSILGEIKEPNASICSFFTVAPLSKLRKLKEIKTLIEFKLSRRRRK